MHPNYKLKIFNCLNNSCTIEVPHVPLAFFVNNQIRTQGLDFITKNSQLINFFTPTIIQYLDNFLESPKTYNTILQNIIQPNIITANDTQAAIIEYDLINTINYDTTDINKLDVTLQTIILQDSNENTLDFSGQLQITTKFIFTDLQIVTINDTVTFINGTSLTKLYHASDYKISATQYITDSIISNNFLDIPSHLIALINISK